MKKWAILGVLAAAMVAAAVVLLTVEFEPRTLDEAFRRAEARVAELDPKLPPDELRKAQDELLARFRLVGERWAGSPEAPKAAARAAELLRAWGRFEEAFEAFKALKTREGTDAAAKLAARELARPEEAVELWKSLGTADGLWTAADFAATALGPERAVPLFEEFARAHGSDERADDAAWRAIELECGAGIDVFPPIEIIEDCKAFLEKHPESPLRPQAMLKLADTYRDIKEWETALQAYDEVIEAYEGQPAAAKALLEKGRILADKLGRKKEAAEAFEDLEKKHPESDEAREGRRLGGGARKAADEEEARKRERDFIEERYGMQGGDLTGAINPITPLEFLSDVIQQKIDLLHFDVDVTPDPSARSIRASAVIRLKNAGDEKSALRFCLAPGMKVSSAALDGKPVTVEQQDARILLNLPGPLAAGAEVELKIEWSGGEGGPGVPMRFGPEGYAAPGAFWYPITYYGDVHTGTVRVSAPGEVRTTYAKEAAFGLYFAYGPYVVNTRGRVSYLTVDADAARVKRVLDIIEDVLRIYEGDFGPLPSPGLAVVDADLPSHAGGISPSGLIFLNRNFMESPKDPTSLIAHELAHQWWGNLIPVTLAREDYSPWLSEGLASWADAHYLGKRFGRERASHHLRRGGLVYLERTMKLRDDSLAKCWNTHPEYTAVIYLKGAAVLDMLALDLGPAFAEGLRRFAKDGARRECSVAEFRGALEAAAGRDLKRFFSEWVDRPGFPRLSIEVSDRTLVIRQEQPLFTLDLEVDVDGARRTVKVEAAETKVELPSPPAKIVLDPDHRILKRPGPANEWTRP